MYKRILWALLSLAIVPVLAVAQSNLTAKANSGAVKSAASPETDRVRDGFNGPVRRVRTEVAKLSTFSGKAEEGKLVLLETAEYDLNGAKTQNQYFPVSGALTGRELYKYDDKGNISEMTLLNTDGSLVSREIYRYEFDGIGNWVQMTTSVTVVENGKIGFEPSEVTYRTIFYYLDAAMAKLLDPISAPAKVEDGKTVNAPADRVTSAASLPPQISTAKLQLTSVQFPRISFVGTSL